MTISFAFASPANAADFQSVDCDVFDNSISLTSLEAFLHDDRHHIAIAKDGDAIIGFVSAIDYFHPDKPRELWINEVSVAGAWSGRGIAKRLLAMMLAHGRRLGCLEAWVLTEPKNVAANALYRSVSRECDPEPTTAIMHSFNLT